MTEERAREILGKAVRRDDGLNELGVYIDWNPSDKQACLDGDFTVEYLEAVVWWMRNKSSRDGG
jgi:hypothetical protein